MSDASRPLGTGPGRRWAPVAAAVGLAATLLVPVTLLILATGWQGVYGQDAYWYHGYATGELRSALLEGRAPAPFTWPPGFPLLAALLSLAVGPATIAGQAVSLAMGAAVPVLTWLLARDLVRLTGWSAWTAPLAGALAAAAPHLWQSAAVVMSDTTGLAAMTLGAWAMVRWAGGGRLRWAVIGAMAVAFAVDARQVYLAAALPLAVAGVAAAWRERGGPLGHGRAITVAVPLLAGAAVLAPVVGPMAWAWLQGEPAPFSIQLASHPWDPGNLVRTEVAGRDGLQRFALPMGLYYLLEPARPYHLGPLFGVAALGGLVRLLRGCRSGMALGVLAGWPLLVLLVLAGDVTQNTRFALALLPPLAILAAGAADGVVRWAVGRVDGRAGRVLLSLGGLVVGLALIANLVAAWRLTDGFIARFQAEGAALAALSSRVGEDDRLIAFGATLALRFAGHEAVELHDLTPDAAVALVGDARRTWVVLPADAFSSQWAATPVARAFDALRQGPGVALVARSGPWDLWSVGGSEMGGRTWRGTGLAAAAVSRR